MRMLVAAISREQHIAPCSEATPPTLQGHMAEPIPPSPDEPDQPAHDPRLEIPEVLRTPLRQSEYDPVAGSKKARKEALDTSGMGRAWAMALDFAALELNTYPMFSVDRVTPRINCAPFSR